jgi:hypothetical protein
LPDDRRRIQTAVLGSADSDLPLMLPLEAIEVDAFRRRHVQDTFWCGLLLGGYGAQLTTKLYIDRVCHFAHFPDSTSMHVCDRRSRDVSSADHLYVKWAAAAWLTAQGRQASFHYPRLDGVPIGSVVDIVWEHGGGALRVHLDTGVPPTWDGDGAEPVLGASVPVDDETLIRHWYVPGCGSTASAPHASSGSVRRPSRGPSSGSAWTSAR